jgi:hypothetical protein
MRWGTIWWTVPRPSPWMSLQPAIPWRVALPQTHDAFRFLPGRNTSLLLRSIVTASRRSLRAITIWLYFRSGRKLCLSL